MQTQLSLLKKSILTVGIFSLTTLVTYGALTSAPGFMKSSPYTTRDTTADAKLDTMTNGAGAAVLDKVVASIQSKAEAKGGTPLNTTLYNAYIDERLSLLDTLDDEIRVEAGTDYAFLFQYIYPRVLELKKSNDQTASFLDKILSAVGGGENSVSESTTSESTAETGTKNVGSQDQCPAFTPISPNSCSGTIVSQGLDANGCQLPPKCVGTTAVVNNNLVYTDSSLGDGTIVTRNKATITGGTSHMLACTKLADGTDCNPTTDLQADPSTIKDGWTYNESTNTYSIDSNVSAYKYPDKTYRGCYKPTGGAVKCFDWKAISETTTTDVKVYVSNTSRSDLSKLNGTTDSTKKTFVIFEGLDQSRTPRACIQPLPNWASVCADKPNSATQACYDYRKSADIGLGCGADGGTFNYKEFWDSSWIDGRATIYGDMGLSASGYPDATYEVWTKYGFKSGALKVGTFTLSKGAN